MHGELDMRLANELMRFTNAVNLAGLPALAVPAGHDNSGAPSVAHLIPAAAAG